MNVFAQQLTLDDVIRRSARAIEGILPQRTMVAVLNFASPSETFSDYVIEELTGELVMGRKVTIVDRRNLELISQEMNLQLSGDVSDESAQAIGRMLGAQSIVSGTLTNMGTYYRFRVTVVNVETAEIQTQVSLDLKDDAQVAFLIRGSPASGSTAAASGAGQSAVNTRPNDGITVQGASLTDKLAWLQRSADSHNTYILVVNTNENIAPHTFFYEGTINITIVLRGDNENRIVRLRSNGTLFTIRPNVTLVLDNNITLLGHGSNNNTLVNVNGGSLIMNNGSAITGNTRSAGGGGGVDVPGGNFTMNGGTISGNTASVYNGGGGVCVCGGTFTMNGGAISGNNTASKANTRGGGGVQVLDGFFNMSGGLITGNTVGGYGGGVFISGGSFTMSGGTISGNTANEYGGGVYFSGGTFNKIGGTITGFNSDSSNGNVVRDDTGNALGRRGSAVFVDSSKRKETTAGPAVNFNNNSAIGWDN